MPQKQGNNERIDMDNINTTPQEENTNKGQFNPKEIAKSFFTHTSEEEYLKELESKEYLSCGFNLFRYDEDGKVKETIPFEIPNNHISLICGKENHGKSRLLQNISLNMIENGKSVLYYTNDDSEEDILASMLNIYVNTKLKEVVDDKEKTIHQKEFLFESMFKKREIKLTNKREEEEALNNRVRAFYELHKQDKIIVKGGIYSINQLVDILGYVKDQDKKPSVIIVDFIQNFPTEERLDIRNTLIQGCQKINEWCKNNHIPVLMGTQLNNSKIETPYSLDLRNIGESHMISQASAQTLLIWDSSKKWDILENGKSVDSTKEALLDILEFKNGKSGKLYVNLKKSKCGGTGLEAVLDFIPETGKIEQNNNKKKGDTSVGN